MNKTNIEAITENRKLTSSFKGVTLIVYITNFIL